MKKIILFTGLIALTFTTQAQIRKGRSMLGGNVGYNKQNSTATYLGTPGTQTNKYSDFNMGVSYGYLLSDHFMLGVQANFRNYKYEQDQSSGVNVSYSEQKTNAFLPGIFARYYQQINGSRFYFFAQLAGAYGIENGTSTVRQGLMFTPTENTSNIKSNQLNINLVPGVVFMVNDKFGIETTVGRFGYSNTNTKYSAKGIETSSRTDGNFYSNLGLSSITLGVNFYFGGKSS